MEVNISEQRPNIQLNRGITGLGWTIKAYQNDEETIEQFIQRLKDTDDKLKKTFKNDKEVKK